MRRAYALGRTIATVLKEAGLTYWSSGGTTLGIVRHGGLIPWDDDLDICILERDEHFFENLNSNFASAGYIIQRAQPYSWKIFHATDSDEIPNVFYTHRYPFCDVFVMKKKKDRFVLKDKTGQNAWPNEYYTLSQVENISQRQFGDFELSCPGSAEEYLDRTYGENWASVGVTHFFCHKSAGLLRPTDFQIEGSMYQPALPFC